MKYSFFHFFHFIFYFLDGIQFLKFNENDK